MRIKGLYLLLLIAITGAFSNKGLISHEVGLNMQNIMVLFSYAYLVIIGLRAIRELLANPLPFSIARITLFEKPDIGIMFLCAVMCHLMEWKPSDNVLLIVVGLCIYIDGKLSSKSLLNN